MVANNATSSPTPDPLRVGAPPSGSASDGTASVSERTSSSPFAPLPLSPSAPSSSPPLRDSAPSAASAFSSPLLLHAFIAANYNISALLTDPRFTPDEIMAFLADPETQTKLTEIAKVAHLGLTIRAAEARHTAINVLEQVAKESDDLVEKRRAAFALYRATASPLIPPPGSARASNSRSRATDPPRVSAPPPLPPAPKPFDSPRPDIAPLDIVKLVSQSLLHTRHNTPEVGVGFATLNAFLTPDATICGVQLPDSSDPDPSNSSCATGCGVGGSASAPDSPLSSPSASSSSSTLSPSSPLRNPAPSAASAFSSPSPAARRIDALRKTPLGELDGHTLCMTHSRDEIGDALIKSHVWFGPTSGGTRHFTYTLETKLFHFPGAHPDCWYITSIDHCDPSALRRAHEKREQEQREQREREQLKQHPTNDPAKPP